jgi:hypothetical protein
LQECKRQLGQCVLGEQAEGSEEAPSAGFSMRDVQRLIDIVKRQQKVRQDVSLALSGSSAETAVVIPVSPERNGGISGPMRGSSSTNSVRVHPYRR